MPCLMMPCLMQNGCGVRRRPPPVGVTGSGCVCSCIAHLSVIDHPPTTPSAAHTLGVEQPRWEL